MSFSESPAPVSQNATPQDGAVVWVVDDSALEREQCRAALASRWEVKSFSSGAAMIEELSTAPVPQVVVLDWHMPDMSGIDVCQFVRTRFDLGQLPILILTASSAQQSLLEALSAGANDFVEKPIAELELNARVAGLVRMSTLYAKLERAERTLRVEADFRERFMGMLAHDLRQPLNTISLAGQAIAQVCGEQGPVPAALGMLQRAAGRMRRMIGELLDFTRIRPESGMPIQRQPMDLLRVVQMTVDEMGIGQELHLTADGACSGSWDPDRLAQVCTNLIANALEHSSVDSPIEVRLECVADEVEFRVSNQGEVIPPEILETLFQPFRRGSGARRSSTGVGLGLYIVDQIVRAHGGSCRAQSDASGTHFLVRLPRHARGGRAS